MRIFFTFLLSFFISISLFAQPSGYYDNATGTGYTLKTQLHNIIKSGHNDQGYGALYSGYVQGDTDPEDGYVWDMYSENPDGADPYNYSHGSNQCGNYSDEGDCYNREHLFPQGIFGSASPMKNDYHHVVPSDGKVNGMRGNYPFGEVANASWTSLNGSKRGVCSYPGYSGTVFEPIDEFKGDIARSMLYFATRYEDRVASWSHEMINGTSDQVYEDWFLALLIDWHTQDPVSQKEVTRNDAGYNFQGNRNPFIDNPDWVYEIWGGGTVNSEPDNHLTSFSIETVSYSTITISWSDATGVNLPDGYVIKANTTGIFNSPVDGTDPSEDSDLSDGSALIKVAYGNESYTFNALNSETTYYFKAWSYANHSSNIDFKIDETIPTTNATTSIAPIAIFTDNFETDLSEWIVTNDTDPDAEAVQSVTWGGAESTSNALLFDAGNPADISYYTSSIEKTFTNVSDLSIDMWYYFEDYRGGEIIIYLNDTEVYSIATEGGGDISISEIDTDIWTNLVLDLTAYSSTIGDYTLKIEGVSKCSSSWKDRVGIDQIEVFGTVGGNGICTDMGMHYSFYPNPATSQVNILTEGERLVQLFDIQGKKIVEKIIQNSGIIGVDKCKPGLYFIRIQNDTNFTTRKIIIQ
jgi:endonuclease I